MGKKQGFLKFWDNILNSFILRNKSYSCTTRGYNFYSDMLGVYSGTNKVNFIYSIDGLPPELEVSYRTHLRSVCGDGVRLSFLSSLEKYNIQWESTSMKAKLNVWKQLEQEQGEIDEYNMHLKIKDADKVDWRKESLAYLSEAELRRKRKTYKLRSLMIISGDRGEEFDNTVKEVVRLCKIKDIKISRVFGDSRDYLSVFSPFSLSYDNKVVKQCGSNVLTDEILSRLNTYSQGIVGKSGIYWGTDIYSSFPCLKPVKTTNEKAETWLVTAETGGGKSFFVKILLLQLIAKSNYNGTIMDIEGFEYKYIANYLSHNDNVVIVNMSEGSGSYFDPMEIAQTGNIELDKDMYGMCTSFTIALFKIFAGNSISTDEWVDIVINDAVSLTYAKAGVTEVMSTWKYSKGLTIFDVYDTLKSLLVSGDAKRAVSSMFNHSLYEERMNIGQKMTPNDINRLVTSNEGYQKAIEMLIAKVSRYFEPNGTRSNLLKNRVTLDTIRDAKLVVCSFGMAGKSEHSVDSVQMALMQLCSANMSHLRSIFSKNDGKFNFKVWEEFQRWGHFPDSEKTITTAITGGRKLGDVNIILTNVVSELLRDDKFNIFSNITSFAVGCIKDTKVIEEFCDRLQINNMLPELELIAKKNIDNKDYDDGDNVGSSPYRKAFLIGLDMTKYSIAKMCIPKELASSELLRTGV